MGALQKIDDHTMSLRDTRARKILATARANLVGHVVATTALPPHSRGAPHRRPPRSEGTAKTRCRRSAPEAR